MPVRRRACEEHQSARTRAALSRLRLKETAMYFKTRAELERQMEAARQLRAETLGGARWLLTGLTSAFLLLRRSVRSRGPGTARQA